jgi:hypothetical protein
MPTKLKVGDAVFFGDPPISYFVEDVDYTAKTADIKTTARSGCHPPKRSMVGANPVGREPKRCSDRERSYQRLVLSVLKPAIALRTRSMSEMAILR